MITVPEWKGIKPIKESLHTPLICQHRQCNRLDLAFRNFFHLLCSEVLFFSTRLIITPPVHLYLGTFVIFRFLSPAMIAKLEKPWQEISAEECAALQASIPKAWLLKDPPPASRLNVMNVPYESGIMTPEELELTEKDATELLELLHSGKLKSYDLTRAFCKRAAIAHQLVPS